MGRRIARLHANSPPQGHVRPWPAMRQQRTASSKVRRAGRLTSFKHLFIHFYFACVLTGVQAKFRAAGRSCRLGQGICDSEGLCFSSDDTSVDDLFSEATRAWIVQYWFVNHPMSGLVWVSHACAIDYRYIVISVELGIILLAFLMRWNLGRSVCLPSCHIGILEDVMRCGGTSGDAHQSQG